MVYGMVRFIEKIVYCPFHKTLPRTIAFKNWISVRFYKIGCTWSVHICMVGLTKSPRSTLVASGLPTSSKSILQDSPSWFHAIPKPTRRIHIWWLWKLTLPFKQENLFLFWKIIKFIKTLQCNLQIQNICMLVFVFSGFQFLLLHSFCFFSSYNPLNSVFTIMKIKNICEKDISP